jgi:hypothetical protein
MGRMGRYSVLTTCNARFVCFGVNCATSAAAAAAPAHRCLCIDVSRNPTDPLCCCCCCCCRDDDEYERQLREQQQLEELEQGRGEWQAMDNNAGAACWCMALLAAIALAGFASQAAAVMAQYQKCWRCVRYQTDTGCIGAVMV